MLTSRSQMIEFEGCRLHVLRDGQGAPVLFLHGATGGGAWLPFMDTLATEYDIIAPDHPGFGKSDDPPWLDNVADLAYFYLGLLKHLGLGPVHIVGTSLGGWIASEMAIRDTSLIRSLTLVCAVGILADGRPIDDMSRLSPDEHARRFCHTPDQIAVRLRQLAETDPAIRARNRATVVRLAWRPRFHNPDLAKWLHRIDRPTRIIWGGSDRIVPLPFGEAYRQAIGHAELVVIPEAGHAPFVDQPDAFADVLRTFLHAVG